MPRSSIWLPPDTNAVRALTSGTLDEADDGSEDRITLYCDAVRVAQFAVPAGRGEAFLLNCGLERQ